MSIDELELSLRSYNSLMRAGIKTVGEIKDYLSGDFMGARTLGKPRGIQGVIDELEKNGYDLSFVESEGSKDGKEKCNELREMRKQIAEENGIEFTPEECDYDGPCAGTCPKCDEEIEYLDKKIEEKLDEELDSECRDD